MANAPDVPSAPSDRLAVRIERFERLSLELQAEMPDRVWVEGDGRMYADFCDRRRVRLLEFDAIKLLHFASSKAGQLISV